VVSGGGPTLSSFTTYIIGNGSNGAGANQIVSATPSTGATTTYAYDGNGNRTGRTISGTTDVFSYDYENRLTSLDYLTGSSGTGMYTYTYDYRTRRVSRTEPSAGTTYIVFDGGVSIEEYTSSPSSPTVEYVRGYNYGGGVGGLEYSVRGGVPSFNFYDSRGDVVAKTNSSGAITWETAYEAFGNETVSTGTTPADRQRASTKEQDPTGFLNEGFRYRDLSTGTFLTRDPLGFLAGLNNYTYVKQNPWTYFDPEGLKELPPTSATPPRTAHAGTETPTLVPATMTIGGMGSFTIMVANPNAYNCHSYAWDNAKGDSSNPKNSSAPSQLWDNDPLSKMAKAQNLKPSDPNKPGDVVVYEHPYDHSKPLPAGTEIDPKTGEVIDHSAVVTQVDKNGNTVRVQGKEGSGPITDHHPDQQNPDYGSDKQWYRPDHPTSPASPQPPPTNPTKTPPTSATPPPSTGPTTQSNPPLTSSARSTASPPPPPPPHSSASSKKKP
jgi:RHS repeat-associated protein